MLPESVCDEFPALLEKYKLPAKKGELEKIVALTDKLLKEPVPALSEKNLEQYLKKRANYLEGLAEAYLLGILQEEFPLLDDKLFSLQRRLTLRTEAGNCYITGDKCEKDEPENKSENSSKNNSESTKADKRYQTITIPLVAYAPAALYSILHIT